MLTNWDIEFLEYLKDTLEPTLNPIDYNTLCGLLDRAYKAREKKNTRTRELMREKRKTDKTYGRPYVEKIKRREGK